MDRPSLKHHHLLRLPIFVLLDYRVLSLQNLQVILGLAHERTGEQQQIVVRVNNWKNKKFQMNIFINEKL